MSEGVYLSRGKTIEQIQEERTRQALRDARPLAIELPIGVARDAMEKLRDREDLLLDINMSLAFLEEALSFNNSIGSNAEVSSLLGLINKAVTAVTESGDPCIQHVENTLREAVAVAKNEEHSEC